MKNRAAEMWRRFSSSFFFSSPMRRAGFLLASRRTRPFSGGRGGRGRGGAVRGPACSTRRRTMGSVVKWRARTTAAALVVGLRNAFGAGPRTVCCTFPPPDACNVRDDYVVILTRYRLDFGKGSEQNGKIPPNRQPRDPVDSLSTCFRCFFGDWGSVPRWYRSDGERGVNSSSLVFGAPFWASSRFDSFFRQR